MRPYLRGLGRSFGTAEPLASDETGHGIERVIPAIVLAGGIGTRLSTVVRDVPKVMAPIRGRPFLEFLVDFLVDQGVTTLVLAVGYKREIIQRHFGTKWRGIEVRYCVEEQPLGTGGAIRKAMEESNCDRAFAFNGDTYCPLDLRALQAVHQDAELTIAVKRIDDVARYGSVELDSSGRIRAFREKSAVAGSGLINAGVYLIERTLLRLAPNATQFSFEADVMQRCCSSAIVRGYITDAIFVDIGVPEDYGRAQGLLQ